jgi:hypothetical protein
VALPLATLETLRDELAQAQRDLEPEVAGLRALAQMTFPGLAGVAIRNALVRGESHLSRLASAVTLLTDLITGGDPTEDVVLPPEAREQLLAYWQQVGAALRRLTRDIGVPAKEAAHATIRVGHGVAKER